MKVEEKIVVLKRMIALSLILTLVSLLLKLFGSEIFITVVNNKNIIAISNFIQSNKWLDIPIKFSLYFVGTFYFMKTVCYSENKKLNWLYVGLIVLIWVVKYFSLVGGFILELSILIILPIIINKQWYRGILGYGILVIFQMISLYARGFELSIIEGNYLLLVMFEIDYYFMILTSYLYVKMINLKNGGNIMLIGIAFLSTKDKQLKALKEKKLKELEEKEIKFNKSKEKLLKDVEEIDKKIEEEKKKHEKKEA